MAKGKQCDEEFKNTIVELYNNKKTACEIIHEYGISNFVHSYSILNKESIIVFITIIITINPIVIK